MKLISPSLRLSAFRAQRAFTLIEMLVVIGIIALLAGLIVSIAPIAMSKMRRSRVEAERDALVTYIDTYKKVKGFYPPDNKNDTVQNALFYELTGTILTNSLFVAINGEQMSTATVQTDFNMPGFINSSADPSEVRNFCGKALKNNQYATVNVTNSATTYTVLGIAVPGPAEVKSTDHPYINPWHYVSSNPTNNPDSYDLWMDVSYGGKTNRISNWSKDPQPTY